LARYTRSIHDALQAEFPSDVIEYVRPSSKPLGWLVRLPAEILRRKFSIFHGTNFETPYVPVAPSVLTLHDLSPWMDADWHSGADRVRLRTPWLLGLGLATMIVTPSEAVRRQAIEWFRLNPARVTAVAHGAAPSFHPVDGGGRRAGYFLSVGTVEPRKNLPRLIEAWRPVYRESGVELMIAGRSRGDAPAIPPEPGLVLAGEAPEEDLPALYSGALAFLYPSLYEGFGLPVLEAMQCGACVLVSTDAALAEVGGEAAVRIDPRDARAWTEALRACVAAGDWIAQRRELSLARAREFSWARSARRTREVYAEAIARFGR
jgi:glycosyltransferase involved in cell wall biosynthesis